MNPSGYEFEGFRIDLSKRLLLRADDETVPLMPKAFDTLLYLVEHPDKVLEKDLLLSEIWPDTIVEENNLTQYISVLRKALGEKPGEHRFIVTIPGRGYKFVARILEVRAHQSSELSSLNHDQSVSYLNRRFDFERRGNVLAVVDWIDPASKSAENWRADVEYAEAPANTFLSRFGKWQVLAIGTLTVIALSSLLGFWKLKSNQGDTDATSERTYTYLTDGVEVVCPAISPDGKYIIYNSFDGDFSHMWLQQVGQSTRLEITQPTRKGIGEKTFSPDGQFIYFLTREENEPISLYKMPVFGGVLTKVLDDLNSPVSFSPDGTEMTFGRLDGKTGESSIVVAKADGSEQRTIQTGNNNRFLRYPSWSPDGGFIAFGDQTVNDGFGGSFWTLAAFSLDRGETISLSPEKWGACYRMGWTAGGEGIVFVGTKAGEGLSTRRDQVWYLELASGKSTRISNEGFRHDLGGVTRDNAVLVHPFDRAAQLWSMDANGDSRSAVRLTSGRSDGRAGIAPLPDGRIAYISRNDDRSELWVINLDGQGKTQISNEPPQIEELRATPDGKYFIFLSHRDNTNHIFRLDIDGSNLKQLTIGNDSTAGDPSISPDRTTIVYSAQKVGGKTWLQKLTIDGGHVTAITGTEFVPQTPHFSPDGSLLSFVTNDNKVGVIPAEGGPPVRIFDTVKIPRINVGARWTPDGKSLAYIVHRNNVSNIWLQPINGDPPQPLTNFTSGDIYNFAFSNDGTTLFLSRGYGFSNLALIKNVVQ